MRKVYVIKNIKTKKYATKVWKWTKDIFEADTFDQKWVDDEAVSAKNGDKELCLGKNERFIRVKMIEA
jgi:hypothetical protein